MPIALALTAGFIQSAISPTVLVTGMLELQRRGYGQNKSEDAIVIFLESMCLNSMHATRQHMSTIVQAACRL